MPELNASPWRIAPGETTARCAHCGHDFQIGLDVHNHHYPDCPWLVEYLKEQQEDPLPHDTRPSGLTQLYGPRIRRLSRLLKEGK